jgi:hypothetical protein
MSLPKWIRAKLAFEHAAQLYKFKHNKPSVIIFDNVDRLKNHPEIIDSLQDSAMKNANNNKYITVFISTKGPVLERMECKCKGYFICNLKKSVLLHILILIFSE